MDFAIGAAAAMGASIFSNPFDVLKTRMQLQGELQARGQHKVHYKFTLHAAYVVVKNEGMLSLQKGLLPALLMHGVRNGVKLGLYQWFYNNGHICNDHGNTIFYKSFLVSALSGATGAFLGNPFFLIKTQLQSQASKNIAVGYQHGHSGLGEAFKTIYSSHGIWGLWRGATATILRSLIGASVQLPSFALTKDALKQYDFFANSTFFTAIAASIAGGAMQTVFQTPFDLVTTRLYNQDIDSKGRGVLYTGSIDCFKKTWKSEGFLGLYKGISANYTRIVRQSVLCLVFWDLLKDWQKNIRN